MNMFSRRPTGLLRLATWNMRGARPKGLPERWAWMGQHVRPDVALLTETSAPSPRYQVIGSSGGIDARRRWGSLIALGAGYEGVERDRVRRHHLYGRWRGAIVAADVKRDGRYLFTAVSMYGMLLDAEGNKAGNASATVKQMVKALEPVISSKRKLIICGDLNLMPKSATRAFRATGLVDLIEATASQRPGNNDCRCSHEKPCVHLWTHKNNSPGSRPIQTDYLFASRSLAKRVISVVGGPEEFPDVWEQSDHAPVVAEIAL